MSLRWLTTDGVVAALVVGALVTWGAGLGGLAVLTLFFVSGSLLSEWNRRPSRAGEAAEAGEAGEGIGQHPPLPPLRNARQVFANGAWAAVGAVLSRWEPQVGWAVLLGSLATAQADTWATEIGARATRPPILITTGRPVTAGTSGGVTALGTSGGILGALVLAALSAAAGAPFWITVIAGAVGVLGMLVDSLLGATLEAASWLDNDGVNLAATSFGAVAAATLTQAVGP